MSARPIDKRSRVPTVNDADPKGRVKVWHEQAQQWVKVDYHTAATFEGVQYWLPNDTGTHQCQHLRG